MKTGIVKDPRFLEHQPGGWHIEAPGRLEVIYRMLDAVENRDRFHMVPVRQASAEELHLIHSAEYVAMIRGTSDRDLTRLDMDTAASRGTYEAARLAAGGVCEAASMVASGLLHNALALVRPPGHHAERDRAMGFCIFNNVAVAAACVRRMPGIERVLVVDWDVHHGNGTQHAFDEDDSVLYFSVHRYPFFPGTGAAGEKGSGRGEGCTVNVPIAAGSDDDDYAWVFSRILTPIAIEFQPDMIFVSTGFDTHRDDPLGGMRMSEEGFARLTRLIMDIAAECCGGKAVFVLEGGYDLDALRDSTARVLDELTDTSVTRAAETSPGRLERLYERVRAVHGKHWRCLRDTGTPF